MAVINHPAGTGRPAGTRLQLLTPDGWRLSARSEKRSGLWWPYPIGFSDAKMTTAVRDRLTTLRHRRTGNESWLFPAPNDPEPAQTQGITIGCRSRQHSEPLGRLTLALIRNHVAYL